ncbi:MAG: WecB/TagA/CpsF family glycosyltransferase [Clostridiales bacterium]|nr:WecB/TagA/CpsF family glycosyltransferase [Clostridiales bacterium]
MELERIDVRGVQVCNVTLQDAVDYIHENMEKGTPTAVYTPNSEIVQLCIDDPSYYPIINSAELIVPDGVGVIKAAKILGTPLKEKVAGVVLGERVLQLAAKEGYPVFLFGGKDASRCESGQSIADQCKKIMEEKYPGLKIVGTKDGYCKKEGPENDQTIAAISASGASILFVCLGAPLQEKWIWENRARLPGVKLFLGLGGSLDVYSGNTKRAPKIFIKLGLEWFYRLCCEPWRIGRMMKLPKFYFGTHTYKRKLKKQK